MSLRGSIRVEVPTWAAAGDCLAVTPLPPDGSRAPRIGPGLAVTVPEPRPQVLHVPYERTTAGIVQHPESPEAPGLAAPVDGSVAGLLKPPRGWCAGRCVLEVLGVSLLTFLTSLAFYKVGMWVLGINPDSPGPLMYLLNVLAACSGSFIMMCFLAWRYSKHVLKREMAYNFLTATVYVLVYVGLLRGLPYLGSWGPWGIATRIFSALSDLLNSSGLPQLAVDVALVFVLMFFRAALPEELLKYSIVRSVVFKGVAVDQYAVMVYSACAGLSFAALENINNGIVEYHKEMEKSTAAIAHQQFLLVVAWRPVFGLVGHVLYAVIQGVRLSRRRFLGRGSTGVFHVIWPSVLLHTAWNTMTTFLGTQASVGLPFLGNVDLRLLGIVGLVVLAIGGWVYARWLLLELDRLPGVDVHALVRSGQLQTRSFKEYILDTVMPFCRDDPTCLPPDDPRRGTV